jgi:NTP pyrophosphatase (non-canonical NTP hydrolase)
MTAPTSPCEKLESLKHKIDRFASDRDWEKFHTPKNLAMALSVESSELLEIFQWLEGGEGISGLSEQKLQHVTHEVADIFIYLLRFCSVTGIDLLAAADEKLKLNELKYPVNLVKGKSDKYNEY